MIQFDASQGAASCNGPSRRDFLRVGTLSAGTIGLSLADALRLPADFPRTSEINCILLFLVGGPSQLETWDPKPNARSEVRGPFRSIRTNVAGIDISEHLPMMAGMADRYAIVRSVHHTEAPIHETGHQLMQTGRLFRDGQEHPHYGAIVSRLQGVRKGASPFVVLRGPIGNTGISVDHGQSAGYLGASHAPAIVSEETIRGLDPAHLLHRKELIDALDTVEQSPGIAERDPALHRLLSSSTKKAFDLVAEAPGKRERYGRNTFGQSCLLARRLIEAGTRFVTVNMFDTVFNEITWDCHADPSSLPTTLADYRDTLCPMFDRAYSALLGDLQQRGLLDTTLVVAMGEFGRTPLLNPRGGRDHWPGVWSVLFAGAGVRGGQVVGASDADGAEPKDRPVNPAEIAATVYHAMGIDPRTTLAGPDGKALPLADAQPVRELFA
jgi:uncharacterized protein (DUF1501 family)